MTTFVQHLYNAAAVSAIYISVALGITLIYGLTGLLNLTIAQLLTLGGFLVYALTSAGVPVVLALVLAAILVGIASELLHQGLLRRTMDRPVNGLVVTLGLVVVLQTAYVLIWGTDLYKIDPPFAGRWTVAGVTIDQPRFVLLVVTTIACLVLFAILELTRVGRALRALASDRVSAELMGIPAGRYISGAFFAGSVLVGLVGGLFATAYPFDAFSGFKIVLTAFAVAIVGGLGSIKGTVVAGLLFGVVQTMAGAYISLPWSEAFALATAVLVLVLRPNGLFGSGSGLGESTFTVLRRPSAVVANRSTERVRFGVGGALVTILVVALPSLSPNGRFLSVATNMLVLAIAAYAFWFALRSAGIFSIASASLIGLGAYVAAHVATEVSTSFPLQLGLAAVGGAAAAVLLGLIGFRTSGSSFVILTLVVAELLVLVARNWTSVTNGQLGLSALQSPEVGGYVVTTAEDLYYLAAGVLAVVVLAYALYTNTKAAWRGKAVRENPALAASLGINVLRERLIVFALSGAGCAMSGATYFYYLRYVEPGTFDAQLSINIILIVLLGGIMHWAGPLVGSIVFAYLPEVLDLSPNWTRLAYGSMLVVVILLLPDGVVGGALRAGRWRGWTVRRVAPGDGGDLVQDGEVRA